MLSKLFIYGSLCEGMVHHKLIKDAILSVEPALIKGTVYRLEIGYPVYLAEGSTSIKGYVVQLRDSELLPIILDEFHGVNLRQPSRSIYERIFSQAMTASGLVDVEVYAMRPKKLPKSAVLISYGDWEEDFKSQKPLKERFSEEELYCLEKIGKTTGREVIQYTPLTRDLEKRGLIIDKGRRPALTPLGKEVFKYLDL